VKEIFLQKEAFSFSKSPDIEEKKEFSENLALTHWHFYYNIQNLICCFLIIFALFEFV